MTNTNTDPNYQDILNKYSQDLKETEAEITSESKVVPESATIAPTESQPEVTPEAKTTPTTNPAPTSELPPEPVPTTTTDSPLSPELASQPEPAPPVDIQPPSETPISAEIPNNPPQKESNFFKYLFFFSLIIFLAVLFFVIRSFLQGQQSADQLVIEEEAIPALSVTPVPANSVHCKFGEQSYALGQTIQADDGCNTCTCEENGELVCTTQTCSATDSAQNNQIDVATSSAN